MELEVKENVKIENMIYEIRGQEVMLDREISATKCHGSFKSKVVTHYDIGKTISVHICLYMKGDII